MQDSARRRQHAAADDLNRSAITEGARHRCEEQEREKAAMRSAILQEVSNTYCRGLFPGVRTQLQLCSGNTKGCGREQDHSKRPFSSADCCWQFVIEHQSMSFCLKKGLCDGWVGSWWSLVLTYLQCKGREKHHGCSQPTISSGWVRSGNLASLCKAPCKL